MAAPMSLLVEFGGGAELLFDGIKKHQVTLPCQPEPLARGKRVWRRLKRADGRELQMGLLQAMYGATWQQLSLLSEVLQIHAERRAQVK
ncbi:ubiquitin-related modifier 1 isoform X2 [Natator depressus]|uniref:ubiquitin-related modifier 1 isoform X2 n=1 Tax=Natator depressus TaxID=27790 RepID=UPI003EBE3138